MYDIFEIFLNLARAELAARPGALVAWRVNLWEAEPYSSTQKLRVTAICRARPKRLAAAERCHARSSNSHGGQNLLSIAVPAGRLAMNSSTSPKELAP